MTEKANTKNNSKESNFIPSMNIKRLLNDVKTIYNHHYMIMEYFIHMIKMIY